MEHEGKINFGNCVENLAANESLRPLPTSLQSNERLFAVLYTSGSTGRPKGARILHRSVLNRLIWQWKTFPYSPKDTCMFKVKKTHHKLFKSFMFAFFTTCTVAFVCQILLESVFGNNFSK